MAQRLAFYTTQNNTVEEKMFNFEWMPGLSVVQKKRSIKNLHNAINGKTLEVSTKSDYELGIKLSAFNLMIDDIPVECIFQSSKCFTEGGPYTDLIKVSPKEAKRDERLKNSGSLIGFEYDGYFWRLDTNTAFYDYIYINAVKKSFSKNEINEILQYEFFTDIEFNHNKSLNTQARAVAIIKALLQIYGEIPDIGSPEKFLKLYKEIVKKS